MNKELTNLIKYNNIYNKIYDDNLFKICGNLDFTSEYIFSLYNCGYSPQDFLFIGTKNKNAYFLNVQFDNTKKIFKIISLIEVQDCAFTVGKTFYSQSKIICTTLKDMKSYFDTDFDFMFSLTKLNKDLNNTL